jgi:single-stranded-DNA-specific exonuclease
MEKWFVMNKRADFKAWSEKLKISQVTARMIRNRDLSTSEEATLYLNGSLGDCYSPWLLFHMREAVEIVLKAIHMGKKIRVIGDYDVDGISSAYILTKGLKELGAQADTVIPHRIHDGYGLSDQLIEEAHQDGIELIITCDNGIAAASQVDRAADLGIGVVVTDHHEVPFQEEDGKRRELLPKALAIVDPKQEKCQYPYPNICGAVVAYKFMQALTQEVGGDLWDKIGDEMLEFAALATVCDVMELKDENRIIVKEGLQRLRQHPNIGLQALAMVNRIEIEKLTVYHLGFVLGPCLNATGRLDSAIRAVELLNCQNMGEAMTLAAQLKELNDSRKNLTKQGTDWAESYIESRNIGQDQVLVIYLPKVHESLAGIIAGKIREKYNRPVLVLTRGEEEVKGSGRSVDAYSMYEELSKCKHFFTKFGGHKLAAGFSLKAFETLCQEGIIGTKVAETAAGTAAETVDKERGQEIGSDRLDDEAVVEELRRALLNNCTLSDEDFYQKVSIDMEMPITYADLSLAKELERLEPFGTGNPKPLFVQKAVHFLRGYRIGANQNFARFRVGTAGGGEQEMIYFGDLERLLDYLRSKYGKDAGEKIFVKDCDYSLTVTYQISVNTYRGRESLQFVLKNYR